MKMNKKKVALALVAMFALAAESSASGGLGVSAGSGASTGLSVSTGSGAYAGSGASTNLDASTNLGTSTSLGTSANIGTSPEASTGLDAGLGVSDDLGVSTGLGVSAGARALTSTSGLTPLDAGIAAAVRVPATTKVTLDSPALGVTSEVVAEQAVDNTSTITVGAPAVAAITNRGDVTAPKLNLTADADTSASTGIDAWVASASATTDTGISAVTGTNIAYAGTGIAGQLTNTFDSSTTVGVENLLPVQLAITADAAVSAVPEADAYAMLLAGLGLMGFMVNRRKEKLK